MEKIGIYGGTFNPIHNGHLNMAKQMGKVLGLDRVLVTPANMPPHKAGIYVANEKHRYEMCRLICEESRLFQVCDIELKREGRSYTVDTLREIYNAHKNCHLHFMMGSDSFLSIIRWVGFEKIIRFATLCTAPRDIKEVPKLLEMEDMLRSKGADTRICDIPIVPISSTEIRNRISKGLAVDEMIPPKIMHYIKMNRLYEKNETFA